jgi:hypothetical protein
MKDILYNILDEEPDKFIALCKFYNAKNKAGYGLFSCLAGECFPQGWIEAINLGIWNEEGPYGDNFRKTFELNTKTK